MLLLSIILLPLLAAVLLALLGGGRSVARWFALLAAVGTLLLSLGIGAKLNSIRDHKQAEAGQATINGPIQPRLEWRRTWMTLGNLSQQEQIPFDGGDAENVPASKVDAEGQPIPAAPETLPEPEWRTVTTPIRLEFYLGADGISVLMLALTAILTISAVLISWESIQDRATEFYICL
ncbi:MAG: NADH-quinone oxidoreductase subunit M, partial [Planctomycetota bacterium]